MTDYRDTMADIRKENGHTQEQLAKAIGWSRPQIARYETKTSTPTIEYLIAFCNFYKVSADRVLGLKDGKNWDIEKKNTINFISNKIRKVNIN